MTDLKQQLQQYVEAHIERVDADDIVAPVFATRFDSSPRSLRQPAWAFALGAVTVLIVGGLVWLLTFGESNPNVAASDAVAPRGVFTFAESDLCDRLSAEQVATFVRAGYSLVGVEWDGDAVAVAPAGSAWDLPGDYCRWDLTGGGYLIARGLDPSQFGRPILYSQMDEDDSLLSAGAVLGYPHAPAGFISANAAFGRYGFWLPGTDEALGLEMSLGGGWSDAGLGWARYERMLFYVASDLLAEIGWAR